MRAGDTFLFADPLINEHLWVIISEPTTTDRRSVIVNMTSYRPGLPRICLISPGEHPFVIKDTIIAYQYAKVVDTTRIIELCDNGTILQQKAVSAALLAKIRKGFPLAATSNLDCVRVMTEHGLI